MVSNFEHDSKSMLVLNDARTKKRRVLSIFEKIWAEMFRSVPFLLKQLVYGQLVLTWQ